MVNNSYYGSYRTRTFADIFEDAQAFSDSFIDEFVTSSLTAGQLETIFYLLYARYGNSHSAYSDENQFKYAVYSTVWQYAPTWAKRLEIQENLRNLTDNELMLGGKAIYNHSFNPSTAPSTSTLEELTTINDQNTTNYKKSKMEGYATLLSLLETDVTEEFIGKFKKHFLTIVAPDYPLLYEQEVSLI